MIDQMLYALPFLMEGLLVTLHASLLVTLFATFLGLSAGIGMVYGPRWLYFLIRTYVDVIRGIPVLVLIFCTYYGLPALGVEIENFAASIVALTAFSLAHVAEITRGAVQSIHAGQMEAGKAIGLNFLQRVIYVIFPQAVRRFLPPWINTVTEIVKGSSLISLIGVVDLMLAVQQVIGRTYAAMPVYLLGAFLYFLINYSLSLTSRRIEARYALMGN